MATHAKERPAACQDVMNVRREVAAAYRLAALFGWDDQLATHISARLPDGTLLINPFGLMFEEVTASSLLRIDLEGNLVEPSGFPVNPAAFTIHSAIYQVRADAGAAIHLHTRDGVAVSTLKEGLLPLNQTALTIGHNLAYHDFEGIANELDERQRIQADLGEKDLMILRNHGTLTIGRTIASAFFNIYALEWCCTTQVRTLGMGRELHLPAQDVQDRMASAIGASGIDNFAESAFWPAMLRKAERECVGFAD